MSWPVTALQTWGSRADALVQLAQALSSGIPAGLHPSDGALGRLVQQVQMHPEIPEIVRANVHLMIQRGAIISARSAYQEAVSWCSADNGDDLPGLLANWASGLTAAAEALSTTCAATQSEAKSDADALAHELLREAVKHAEASLDFNRGDIQVLLLIRPVGPTVFGMAAIRWI